MQHTEARTQPPHCGSCVCRYGRYEEQNGTAKEQYGVDDGLSEDMQRADHRGHSEDKQDVEQVGADGIAQRQPAVSLFVATMEVTSSGREVPMAIMVSPMKFWLTPKFVAMMQALSTTRSPPKITAARPPAIYKRLRGRERILPGSHSSLLFPGRIDHKSEIYDHAQQQDSAFNAA